MRNDDDQSLAAAPLPRRGEEWDRYSLTEELESFLREAGTPEELRIREERLLFEFQEILRTVPPEAISDEQRFFVGQTMNLMRDHLGKLREQAEWAVAMLSRDGWRFDRALNRLAPAAGLSRMRRQRFTDEVVASYRGAGRPGNTRAVRVRIAEALRDAYPPEMLSPRAYFPIWQVIEDHLKKAG
jgi:hypothetical protein